MATGAAPERSYDGSLPTWEDVEERWVWDTLVLGNGFSVNIWEDFKYDSLYEEARHAGLIAAEDATLFDHFGATNFEAVLRPLHESIRVGEALGRNRTEEQARYKSIQGALADAVHRVHLPPDLMPTSTLQALHRHILEQRHVFTTNYDLLLYWAMACTDNLPDFLDFFWAGPHQDAFNEARHDIGRWGAKTRIYFLHGALHIAVMGDESTCKRRAGSTTLLDSFGMPYRDDAATRPLIVSESHASSKERAIAANEYLTYCWSILEGCTSPTVVLGHGLGQQDQHLINALNRNDRPIAVGIHRKTTDRDNKSEKHRISAALADISDLSFFESSTHPMTLKKFRVSSNPFLRRVRRPFAA